MIRLLHHEYWPMWLLYLPVAPYWLWLMMKCRSWHFYKYTNPSIFNGGLIGESKKSIMDEIHEACKPVTLLFDEDSSLENIQETVKEAGMDLPVIVKPDKGEQGRGVQKISDWNELHDYLLHCREAFLLQEYIDLPMELAVFFVRFPGEESGRVTSVTTKEFLSVTGDGYSDIRNLMQQNDRARFQAGRLAALNPHRMKYIPDSGERVVLEVVGNHCRGTKFINGNHLINRHLHEVFNRISRQMPDFYYGRYDLKVASLDDLYRGINIRIMELNGAGAIPAHIFDPGHSLVSAWRDILYHWRMAGEIAKRNKKSGRTVR